MSLPLEGRTVALAEARQLEELAALFVKEGATVLRCPLVSILDAQDAAPIVAWLRDLAAGRFDYVIFMTGEGIRRLIGFAERAGIRDQVVAALGKTRTVTRGPKPVKALKEIGLAPSIVAAAPTTEGIVATLSQEPLSSTTVGVQFHGEINQHLLDFLHQAGATAVAVQPYYYAPAADAERVADLIARMARGDIDLTVFTSSPQVDRLQAVAEERGLSELLGEGLAKTCVAAIGPIAADSVRAKGWRVDITPEQGFVMKNLVQQIKRELERKRPPNTA
jgi:uroporphyrinogen-III synthase